MENQDDATYDSTGFSTDTDSLSSSINEYIFENGMAASYPQGSANTNEASFKGRRYHAYYGADKNLHPTDEQEQDRLDIHHEIFLQLLSGDLNKAPVVKPQRVLDIGTGTGLWAIDIANKFPSAVVVGTDLSPIQPQWVPPNCKFEVDDAELDFTYKDVCSSHN